MSNTKCEIVKSVGIDIGTTTTQLVISRLTVKNIAPGTLVPRMQITDKTVEYKSEVHFTPIKEDNLIDVESVFQLVNAEFKRAGISPQEIDTGAVIITGETAKKENAKRISHQVAGFAGDFVVATAGGKLEAIIAGKGSGASDYSRKNYCTVANIDIGGGTANVGIYKNGKAIDSCCINVGGRLLQVSKDTKRVENITEPMKNILSDCGLTAEHNEAADLSKITRISRRMAQVITECISSADLSDLSKSLLLSKALRLDYDIDAVMVSGGVADYVYHEDFHVDKATNLIEVTKYGDIGPMLGYQVRIALCAHGYKLLSPTETIRATVIGAGSQTVDVSGSTILVNDEILPMKNIPVAIPFQEEMHLDEEYISRNIIQSIDNFFEEESLENIAIALQHEEYLSFNDINVLARGIVKGTEKLRRAGLPLILVIEQDLGKVMGQTIKFINRDANVICIDQVKVNEGDYVDIGKSIAGGTVVPVIIKTLVFETKQRDI